MHLFPGKGTDAQSERKSINFVHKLMRNISSGEGGIDRKGPYYSECVGMTDDPPPQFLEIFTPRTAAFRLFSETYF